MTNKKKPTPELNKANKVAQFANPRHRGLTKAESRLKTRQKDWEKKDWAKGRDVPEGAFHKPGSLKKG
jgi:hypothetical protein